uniref:Uncharacterized protein n=1 Tax=Kalanchoe fedtschenkoi TaxID=63787 RepID=A0A7N1A6E4_KALFE
MSATVRSHRKAAVLCARLSPKTLSQPLSPFSTSASPRKLIKAQSSLPQSSNAFAYATQNLIGHVRMPGQFQVSDFGKTYWDACTIVLHESNSKSKPRWIPVLFQGEAADNVAYHLKETEYAFIPGRVCAQPSSPPGEQDQIESGRNELDVHNGINKIQSHTIIPLLPLKSSIFVHDALAAQLMFLVT